MTIYNPSTLSLHEASPSVKSTAGTIAANDDLNAREDRRLRLGNGIRDEDLFPLLRMAGFAEDELHAAVMSMLRDVQYGRDQSGDIAKTTAPEVV